MTPGKPQASTSTWFEIAVPTHEDRVDLVTGALAERGVAGTEVREPRPGAAEVVFHVEAASAEAARSAALELVAGVDALSGVDLEVRGSVTSQLWTENWRKHFVPLDIGRSLAIVPPWEAAEREGRTTIVVNPGGAFGTGQHETTWLCLEALEDFVRPGSRVADLGCGSGILAVAAAKLGAAFVLASVVDPAAIDVTRENAERNGVSERIETALASTPPKNRGRFDLVVANIYSDTLMAISEDVASITAADGIVVLSGVETTRSAELIAAFVARGFALEQNRARGDWSALVFNRTRA